MNLTFRINRKSVSKALLSAVLLSVLPVITGSTPAANAASLSTTQAASACASMVSDSSTAKLDVRVDGNYCVLSFLSGTNTFMPPTGVEQVEYLAIGGGGGGGGGRGGGGGAGGFVTNFISTTSQISITVGNGGAGAVNSTNGTNGETTTISFSATSINAIGGGGGGASFGAASSYPARSGASGGGAGIYASSLTENTDGGTPGGLGISGQGNNGGSSGGKNPNDGTDPSYSYKGTCTTQNWDRIRNTAGGGGAGGKGISGRGGAAPLMTPANLDSCQTPVAPNGGAGRSSNITGSSRLYAAGGGGSAGRFDKASENVNYYTAPAGAGGSGIGGAGSAVAGTNGGAGFPNTGSGGGGGGVSRTNDTDKGACASGSDLDESCDGGAGGSGIVIIRYLKFLDNALECVTGVSDTRTAFFAYSMFQGDCILTFKSSALNASATNSWTVPSGTTNARMLLVGGGGGGGNDVGGGGGGGQVLDTSTVAITPATTLSIYIGAGGGNGGGLASSATRNATNGINGESTTVSFNSSTIRSLGGGGSWGRDQGSTPNYPDWDGVWSQGGNSWGLPRNGNPWSNAVGGWLTSSGYSAKDSYNYYNAGGGGGAGGSGSTASTDSNSGKGGDGGVGVTTDITGFAQCLGGGGGGAAAYNNAKTRYYIVGQGKCGGGNGLSGAVTTGGDATPNTGSGGGGGAQLETNGGYGSSGIVIIRFTLRSSNQPSQNLNMACHGFSSATDPTQSLNAGYLGTPFTTDTTTAEFTFPTSSDTTVRQDWGSSSPTGCSSSTDYFTVYVWGYIQAPSSSQSSNVWFATRSDDGVKVKVDGTDLILNTNNRGLDVGIDTATAAVTMAPNSWHFIQMWVHENTGGAGLELYWQTNSSPQANAWNLVPRTFVSRTVPRTMTFAAPSLSSSIMTATVDTSTVVYGGPNAPSTLKSTGGTMAFYESGTAIAGCSSVVAVKGVAQCDLGSIPSIGTRKYYKVIFTPETSTASTDIQHNVYALTQLTEEVTLGKHKNATLKIGQYIAFTGVSTYPLNVYGDGTIYGAITRSLTDSGSANCSLDVSKYFLSASRVGSCIVTASAAGDATHFAETTTATIYWIQWSDAYATRVPSGPTEIVLSHKTQITKYNFETLTVTSYQNGSGGTVTQIAPGAQLRIIGDGFDSTDSTTEVVFGNAEIVDMTYSTPALQIVSDGSGGYYLLVTVPSAATTDSVIVNSRKGTAAGPTLTITP